jgi:hypothetical protein
VFPLTTADEPPAGLDERLGSYRTHLVPIDSLLPADSPRLAGEIEEHAQSLAEAETPLPPIVVHQRTMRVVDGMHRLRAAALRGDTHIDVRLVDGTAEEVFALAVELNAEHGLPLSRQDRVAAAVRIIASLPHWSDRRIAAVTGLSAGTVGSLRGRTGSTVAELARRTGRDGRARPVNSAIGRIAASKVIEESPDASLREIASRAGVALATARDVRNRIRLGQDPVPPRLRSACGGQDVTGEPLEPDREPNVPPGVVSEAVLSRMRRDPSLRMSQNGRMLLHLLASHLLTDQQRQTLVEGVPAHRAADVAHAARLCADHWLRFASDVEVRSRDHDGVAGQVPVPSYYGSA